MDEPAPIASTRPVTGLVEVVPSQPLGDRDPSILDPLVTPFVESLRAVYHGEAQRYVSHIEQVTQTSGPADLTVGYATRDGGPDEVAIDADLFGDLFGVYLCDGWPAIKDIEAALRQKPGVAQAMQDGPWPIVDPPSGGTPDPPDNPWPAAYWFFIFTRNLLAVIIRDALIEIEQRSATAMVASLTTSAAAVDAAFAAFGIDPTSGRPTRSTPRLAAATVALRDAVAVRGSLDQTAAQLKDLAQQLDAYRAQHTGVSGGTPLQDPFDSAAFTALLQAQTTALHTQLRQWYTLAARQIELNEPMALVLLEGLPPQFTETEIADRLAEVLTKLRSCLAEVTGAIHPQQSRVAQRLAALPGLDRATPVPPEDRGWRADVTVIDPSAVHRLVVPADGPEVDVIDSAMSALSGDHGALPLLHEQTWRLLVARGDVAVDSLTYVVHHQYLLALDRQIEERERLAAQNAASLALLSRASAVLSMGAFAAIPFSATGVGAVVAGLLRGAAMVVDALVLASMVHSVVEQLSKYDTAIASTLVAPGAAAMPGLAAVGSLVLARSEYTSAIAVELLGELMLQAVGSRWRATRGLLLTRGFVMDVRTAFGMDATPEDGD